MILALTLHRVAWQRNWQPDSISMYLLLSSGVAIHRYQTEISLAPHLVWQSLERLRRRGKEGESNRRRISSWYLCYKRMCRNARYTVEISKQTKHMKYVSFYRGKISCLSAARALGCGFTINLSRRFLECSILIRWLSSEEEQSTAITLLLWHYSAAN